MMEAMVEAMMEAMMEAIMEAMGHSRDESRGDDSIDNTNRHTHLIGLAVRVPADTTNNNTKRYTSSDWLFGCQPAEVI